MWMQSWQEIIKSETNERKIIRLTPNQGPTNRMFTLAFDYYKQETWDSVNGYIGFLSNCM